MSPKVFVSRHTHRIPITDSLSLQTIFTASTMLGLNHQSHSIGQCYGQLLHGVLCFHALGEFTSTIQDGEHIVSVSFSDVLIDLRTNPQVLSIHLRHTETDQFSEGTHIHLGHTGDYLCPVAAILAYLAVRPMKPGPLLVFQDGSPLSRQQLIAHLRSALSEADINTTGFSGHSFRMGAATTADSVGLSDSLIQHLGRWKSAAFKSHIRKSSKELQQSQHA